MYIDKKYDIRTGVIGGGIMGKNHARIYSQVSDFKGIFDIDDQVSASISDKFSVNSYKSIKALLSDIDAVSVAVPTEYHYEISKQAIKMGKHVLVEKPITNDPVHAEELISLSKKNEIVFAVGHIERHNPIISFIKDELKKGSFGNLISISSRRISNYPNRIRDVGVVHDLGIHDLDISSYLSESKVNRVDAVGGSFNNPNFEDNALIIVSYENSVNSFAEVNWLTPTKIREINLTFDEAYLHGDYIKQEVKVIKGSFSNLDHSDLSKVNQSVEQYNPNIVKSEPLMNEIMDFLYSVRHGGPVKVTGEDGLNALKLANMALSSLNEDRIL